ncbi:TetR/AcrR family transcriptional regulator C-terminal domain-containing protein [Paenibacillus chartarius]|uniref:TetR/AcrR family transcriptional regulator C-terminal domain-containing protein n=1 Tax=Paenibacillus chartarius TaxID=747481 RepID=A0ABV6DP17_9BACL
MRKKKPSERKTNKLDQSLIVHAAIDIIQEEGIDKLTMRRLAQKLNIKGASLYWHVQDKNELLSLAAEEICQRIQFPDERLPWEEQLLEFGRRCRNTYLQIRNSVHVLVATPPITPYRMHLIHKINRLFELAGFKKEDVFSAGWMLNNYICSFILDEYRLADMESDVGVPDLEREFYFGIDVLIKGFRYKLQEGRTKL